MEQKLINLVTDPLTIMRYTLLPLGKKEREERLDYFRELVDHFKPGIEEKTGISLEDIRVKDFSYMFQETIPIMRARINKGAKELRARNGKELSNIEKKLAKGLIHVMVWPFIAGYCILKGDLSDGACTVLPLNTIYIPSGYSSKAKYVFDKILGRDKNAKIIAHELAHVLWDKINPKDKEINLNRNRKEYEIWSEGFATFCGDEYFKDLYPNGQELRSSNYYENYKKGREKCRKVFEIGGEQALLSLPLKWREWQEEIFSEEA